MGATSHVTATLARRGVTPTGLWAGVLVGPLAWAFALTAKYSLMQWACRQQHPEWLHLVTFVSLVAIVIAAATSWRAALRLPRSAPTNGGHPDDFGRFLALLGLASSALFAVATIATAVPEWVLDACR